MSNLQTPGLITRVFLHAQRATDNRGTPPGPKEKVNVPPDEVEESYYSAHGGERGGIVRPDGSTRIVREQENIWVYEHKQSGKKGKIKGRYSFDNLPAGYRTMDAIETGLHLRGELGDDGNK